MHSEFESISKDEIVSIEHQPIGQELGLHSNNFSSIQLKMEDFLEAIKRKVNLPDQRKKDLFNDGIDCQVLKFRSESWQKGKIKIRVIVEFCPDEPEISEPEARFDDVR
ncbi:MAG: hypothetical protein KME06_04700 [Kastovskya adunca ATA6-11-RM4]|jgi:hypothetical protein|nr:hypothetical protein [Kastovskya adunca ATA6-11-RM4]